MSARTPRRSALVASLAAVLAALVAMSSPAQAPADVDGVQAAADDDLTLVSRRLNQRLAAALSDPCLRDARVGMTVRDLSTGRVLFTRAGDEPLSPASNLKLVTAAALQALLGPEHVIRTSFRADRMPDATGDVGTLYVVGGGDPSITVETLYGISRELAAAGVRGVQDIVVDDSYFEGPGRAPTWPERNHGEWYSAPCSALCANFNVVAVHARGTTPGQAAQVWLDPFPTFFDVQGRLVTGRGPWGVSTDSLVPAAGGGAVQVLTVVGRVPPGKTVRELRAVEDPALYCGHGLAESLSRVAIAVGGSVRRGRVPDGAVVLHEHQSRPLALLVHDMNKESSNVFAETLLRVLGAELIGPPGSREKGIAVAQQYLSEASPRASACRLVDGSGLSPENRLTANVVADLLLTVARDPFTFPEFVVSLPIGGIDGTMRRRLDASRAARLVRAKTGRINGVVALSGLARVEASRDAVFALLVNDYHCPTWKAQDAVDRVAEALVADTPAAPALRGRVDMSRLTSQLAPGATAPGETDGPPPDDAGGGP